MDIGETFLSEPKRTQDPVTGRNVTRLTSGDCFDYPMYYYIPTLTSDGNTIVFYRYERDDIQHYKIEIESGLTTKLTAARTPNCLWRPWCYDTPATGVRDLMSAFDPVGNELFYFDGNEVHAVNIDSLADRVLYRLPDDRTPCSLTGVSPDGKWFCFAHCDAGQWQSHVTTGPDRTDLTGVRLEALRIEAGKTETLVETNNWITHANFYDADKVLFCHAAKEHAILLTDLSGGYYKHLRTMRNGLQVCHYQATEKGILYEVITKDDTGRMGICDPETNRCAEYTTPTPVYHIGYDVKGRLWFHSAGNIIAYFPALATRGTNGSIALTGTVKTYSKGQRSHLHPAMIDNRQGILYTGGDPESETNHLFLLDTTDLSATETLFS